MWFMLLAGSLSLTCWRHSFDFEWMKTDDVVYTFVKNGFLRVFFSSASLSLCTVRQCYQTITQYRLFGSKCLPLFRRKKTLFTSLARVWLFSIQKWDDDIIVDVVAFQHVFDIFFLLIKMRLRFTICCCLLISERPMTTENFCRAQNIHGITNITILMIEQDMPKETGHKQIKILKNTSIRTSKYRKLFRQCRVAFELDKQLSFKPFTISFHEKQF